MRILIVPSWYPRPSNPQSGVYFRNFAQALADAGHEVRVAYAYFAFSWRSPERPSLRISSPGPGRVQEYVYLAREWFPKRRLYPAWLLCITLAFRKAIMAALHDFRAEVIHSHALYPSGPAAALTSLVAGCPWVATEHASKVEDYLSGGCRLLSLALYSRADRLVAVSPSLVERLRSQGVKCPVAIVPNLVDLKPFIDLQRPRARVDERIGIVCVGSLRKVKGLDAVVRATAVLSDLGHRNASVDFVGDGPQRASLVELATRLGIQDRVRFWGVCPPEEVRSALASADVFVLPSRSETFGIAFLEAVAAGLPVVATRCGGPEWFLDDGLCIFVGIDQPEEIAHAVLEWRERGFRPDESCRRRVLETFNPDRVVERYSAVYAALAQPGRGSRTARGVGDAASGGPGDS